MNKLLTLLIFTAALTASCSRGEPLTEEQRDAIAEKEVVIVSKTHSLIGCTVIAILVGEGSGTALKRAAYNLGANYVVLYPEDNNEAFAWKCN